MPAKQYAFTIGTSRTALDGTEVRGWLLYNNSANTIYLGDDTVTTANGFPVLAGAYFSPAEIAHERIIGQDDNRLYAIAASAGNDVRVLVPAGA